MTPYQRRSRPRLQRGGPALVGFLTAGFPSRRQFRENLAAVQAACDVVEIGVPFSDPMADGSTIQRASFIALADGVTLPWILEEVLALPRSRATPILLMSYLNPLLELRARRLAASREPSRSSRIHRAGSAIRGERRSEDGSRPRGAGAGADGDAGDARAAAGNAVPCGAGLRLRGHHDRHHRHATSAEVPEEVLDYMDRVKRFSQVPVCAGFGIRSHAQVARFAPHVDGVVVGSALVETLERGEDVRAFLVALR